MKLRFVQKVVRHVGAASRWADHKRGKGFCTVVSIKCTWCGQWVKPEDWDPKSPVCDECTAELKVAGAQTRKPERWIATGNGRSRRNTGAVK